jgi:acyl dehydratase
MGKPISLEELRNYVGKKVGVSQWFPITQERVTAFAELTEDRQWIHVNPELARKGPYGTTVAHGFMVISLLSYFGYQNDVFPAGVKMALNYGLNRVRFITPLKVGSRIRNHAVLKEIQEKGEGRLLLVFENTIEIEGEEKPAAVAESLSMLFV